jgi:hypothetical protein
MTHDSLIETETTEGSKTLRHFPDVIRSKAVILVLLLPQIPLAILNADT